MGIVWTGHPGRGGAGARETEDEEQIMDDPTPVMERGASEIARYGAHYAEVTAARAALRERGAKGMGATRRPRNGPECELWRSRDGRTVVLLLVWLDGRLGAWDAMTQIPGGTTVDGTLEEIKRWAGLVVPAECAPHGAQGPRCCVPAGHEGPHLFRCAGTACPGLPWPASVAPHPAQCSAGR